MSTALIKSKITSETTFISIAIVTTILLLLYGYYKIREFMNSSDETVKAVLEMNKEQARYIEFVNKKKVVRTLFGISILSLVGYMTYRAVKST